MRLLLKYLLFILLPAYTYGQSGRPDAGITFEVTDSLHNPLAYATVALTPMSGGGGEGLGNPGGGGGAPMVGGGGKGLRDDDR